MVQQTTQNGRVQTLTQQDVLGWFLEDDRVPQELRVKTYRQINRGDAKSSKNDLLEYYNKTIGDEYYSDLAQEPAELADVIKFCTSSGIGTAVAVLLNGKGSVSKQLVACDRIACMQNKTEDKYLELAAIKEAFVVASVCVSKTVGIN